MRPKLQYGEEGDSMSPNCMHKSEQASNII
jgi:hypothetical protein